jgi:hypothetical protein
VEASARQFQLSESDSGIRVVVRRRPQQVVVRAGDASNDKAPELNLERSDTPTLLGLDVRERQDTLPDEDGTAAVLGQVPEQDWSDDARTLVALKKRPVVIREGRDDMLVEQYRAEARRILESGIFE